VTVDPPASVLVWTTVVRDAEVGVLEVVDDGCVVVAGVEDVEGVLDVEETDEDGGVVEVLDCEVDEVKETEEEVEIIEEDVESVGVAVEVGLLLAIELDDDTTEELVGVAAAWEDVSDVEETPVSVLVELEDIVNCLNLRSLGRLKPRINLCVQHLCVDREGVDVSTLARASEVLLAA
jgi:hypothetical protein